MADRICVMNHGRIEQIGSPQEVYYRPANEYVARFFGDNNLIEVTLRPERRRLPRSSTPPSGAFRCVADGVSRRSPRRAPASCSSARRRSLSAPPTENLPIVCAYASRRSSFVGPVSQVRVRAAGRARRDADGQAAEPRRRACRSASAARREVGWSDARMSPGHGIAPAALRRTRARTSGSARSGSLTTALAYALPAVFILVPLVLFLIQSFFYVEHGEIVRAADARATTSASSPTRPSCRSSCAPACSALGVAAICVALRLSGRLSAREPAGPAEIRADARLRHPAADELHHQDLRDPRDPRRQRLPQPHAALPRHHRPAAHLPDLQPQRRAADAVGDPPALRDPADLHRARAHPAQHARRLRRSRRLVLADLPRASSGRSACRARSSARPSPSCWRSAISSRRRWSAARAASPSAASSTASSASPSTGRSARRSR